MKITKYDVISSGYCVIIGILYFKSILITIALVGAVLCGLVSGSSKIDFKEFLEEERNK